MMKKLPDKTFDFCFADPPYFMNTSSSKLVRPEGTNFSGCDDEWDKFNSMEDYCNWTKKWLKEVNRILKKDGSICVISSMQSIFEIGAILRELGFWIINDIIWKKSNPTPNFGGTRLNNSHETLIWATKSKNSKIIFNYKTGKELNGGKQMGSIWEFSVCNGAERLKDDNNEKLHNTQKPEALLERVITLFTKPDALVIDPFGGTMTTGAICKKLGRQFTMIERDEKYIKYGLERINKVIPISTDFSNAIFDIPPTKARFVDMVNAGFFTIGEKFFIDENTEAILNDENGKLSYNGIIMDMHNTATKMLKKENKINAYDYLFVKRNDKLVSIREIRDNYRKSIESEKEKNESNI